ncbi:MAG: hypothetical protein HC904_14740 [Blastochloris sp.]|nr:hypothetical protein [Blastochloris sp.]
MTLLICLIAAGFILLLAEIFLPGMIAGSIGVLCLLAAVVVTGILYGPISAMALLGALFVIGLILFLLWMKYYPRSPLGRRMTLQQVSGQVETKTDLPSLGDEGLTVTPLRPSGTALFHGKRYDVMTEGSHLDPQCKVKVVKVQGLAILVRGI